MTDLPHHPQALYTCIGKGGAYEFLGVCIGAGTNKGHDTLVYRDIFTGQLFSRLADDFETRLRRLPGVPERV